MFGFCGDVVVYDAWGWSFCRNWRNWNFFVEVEVYECVFFMQIWGRRSEWVRSSKGSLHSLNQQNNCTRIFWVLKLSWINFILSPSLGKMLWKGSEIFGINSWRIIDRWGYGFLVGTRARSLDRKEVFGDGIMLNPSWSSCCLDG